jgi:hypothetical protein
MNQFIFKNISEYNLSEYDKALIESLYLLDQSKKVSIYANLWVILIGLLGNFLTITIFIQPKFRTNSSHVFLLWLAGNDSVYLIIHLFEDTLQKHADIFTSQKGFISILNIVHKNDLACRLVHYLRNVLRIVSAYVIVAYTIQRLFIISRPFSTIYKSKKSAWKVSLIIYINKNNK